MTGWILAAILFGFVAGVSLTVAWANSHAD